MSTRPPFRMTTTRSIWLSRALDTWERPTEACARMKFPPRTAGGIGAVYSDLAKAGLMDFNAANGFRRNDAGRAILAAGDA